MIWDQLLSSWDCDVNSGADSIHNHCVGHGLLPTHPSIWRWLPRFCVLCQWLLATWLLSTWLGDWLASQSPNPSWHHRLSTETTVKYSNSVSSCALCCNGVSVGWLGVWLQSHAIYQCSEVRNQQNPMVFFRKLLVWCVGVSKPKTSDFANQNFWGVFWHLLFGGCQLGFVREWQGICIENLGQPTSQTRFD